jgi:hypothetical protein
VCDTPEDFNDIGGVCFRCVDNDKTLPRKHESAIVSKESLLETQPEPERAKPRNHKTEQRQQDLRPSVCPENLAQEHEAERQSHGERGPAVRRKSGMQNLEATLFSPVNDRRPPKVILPDLVKCFLGMF